MVVETTLWIVKRWAWWTLAGVLLLGLCGCGTTGRTVTIAPGAVHEPSNLATVGVMPADIRKVAVLPLFMENERDDSYAHYQRDLVGMLAKKNRFEVVEVPAAFLLEVTGGRQLDETQSLQMDFFVRLFEAYAVDAVLFSRITYHRPYRPVAIGFRARLVRIARPETFWAFDEVFDAGDPRVARSARYFQAALQNNGYPLEQSGSILISPHQFARYVFSEAFRTLPFPVLAGGAADPAKMASGNRSDR